MLILHWKELLFKKISYFIVLFLFGTSTYILFFNLLNLGNNNQLLIGEVVLLLFISVVFVFLFYKIAKEYLDIKLVRQDLIIFFLILFFFNYNVYGLIPFNASRSNTVIIMEYLNSQNGESLDKNEILVYVNDKYFYEYDAVQKRLDEQVNAGNIIKSGDKYKISNRGAFILNLFGFITNIYGIENNFISNNWTKLVENLFLIIVKVYSFLINIGKN